MRELNVLARFGAFATTAALLLAGCSSGPSPVPGAVDQAPPFPGTENRPAPSQDQLVLPLDTLNVTVLREPDLSMDAVVVGMDGGFMMPLVGWVEAADKAPREIAQFIQASLAEKYLRSPQVTVNITALGSHTVTVEGAVEDPGVYEFSPGTTLLGAIALADGPSTSIARLDEIAIFRTIDGENYVAVYDLKKIRAGQLGDPHIQPGDRVVINFSAAGEGLENFLRTVPLIGIFSRW